MMQMYSLFDLAAFLLALDETAAAQACAAEVLEIARELASRSGMAEALYILGEVARGQRDLDRAQSYYQESLPLLQAIGMRDFLPAAIHNLGAVALDLGDTERARELYRESLAMFLEQHSQGTIAEALTGLARVAVVDRRPRFAARLWGAAEACQEANAWVKLPIDQAEQDRYVAMARAACGARAFAAAWQAGRALTIEQAVAEAMADGRRAMAV
jgi:tetratricopeptide (TPR) repeat protein